MVNSKFINRICIFIHINIHIILLNRTSNLISLFSLHGKIQLWIPSKQI